MIDTIKIYSRISDDVFNLINFLSDKKQGLNTSTGELYYEITNEHLKGSYDGSLSVKVLDGDKYKILDSKVIEIEGSYHKFLRGQNAFNGFYNIQEVVENMIGLVEGYYNISLPSIENWYLQRIDIAKCFDLQNQSNVVRYINNFRLLSYPRRRIKFYKNECIYFPGTTTTLKIYNKLREFNNNDRKNLKSFKNFDLFSYQNKINGFVRFEIEILVKKLKDINCDNRVINFRYFDLVEVWKMEFEKVLRFDFNNYEKVNKSDDVMNRLYDLYKPTKASVLYSFYLVLIAKGYDKVKEITSSSTFYRKLGFLVDAGIDFSQSDIEIMEKPFVMDFNPFVCKEVA